MENKSFKINVTEAYQKEKQPVKESVDFPDSFEIAPF